MLRRAASGCPLATDLAVPTSSIDGLFADGAAYASVVPLTTTICILCSDPDSAPSAFEIWASLIVPTIIGVASAGVAVAAVIVARRSNRFARAATEAAQRSNELAERANRLEEMRDLRFTEADARAERQAFADQWIDQIRELAFTLRRDRDRVVESDAYAEVGRLKVEGNVRELGFPAASVVKLLFKGADAHVGEIVVAQAVAAASALIHRWVRSPGDVEVAEREAFRWLEARIEEAKGRVSRGEKLY